MFEKEIPFDPGYAPILESFSSTAIYTAGVLQKFKNQNQKKFQYFNLHKQLISLYKTNLGFYAGCMLWALYIKSYKNLSISGNHALEYEFDEASSTYEIDFMLAYLEQFKRDFKFYLNKNFELEQEKIDILNIYKEFIILNKGFHSTKITDDVLLPNSVKFKFVEPNEIYEKIKTAINDRNLFVLTDLFLELTKA